MAASEQLLNAVARITTFTSADYLTRGFKNVVVTLKTTAIGTGNITLTINRKDMGSLTSPYILLLSGAAVSTNTTNTYTVGQVIASAANVSALALLPETIQIVVTANNANPADYTVGVDLI